MELVLVGRQGVDFFRRRSWTVVHDERDTMSQGVAGGGVRAGAMFGEAFVGPSETDAVWLLYNRFRSV